MFNGDAAKGQAKKCNTDLVLKVGLFNFKWWMTKQPKNKQKNWKKCKPTKAITKIFRYGLHINTGNA